MEYAAKFNKLNRFTPAQVATAETTVHHFEQGLKENIIQMVTRHAYADSQEMYLMAMKIARVMDENDEKRRGKH